MRYLRRTENLSEKKEEMVERLGKMRRKVRRERIEKGSRERIQKERKQEKETKGELRRQFEEEEGLKETISHRQVPQSHKYISKMKSFI